MTITSIAGTSVSVSDSVSVANAVTTCTGSGCSGTVTTSLQTVHIASTSTSGTILTDVGQGTVGCGDIFRHAPQVTTVTDTGLNADLVFTVTFANKSAAGNWFIPFAVCYTSTVPFVDLTGKTVTTGLLPICGGLFGNKAVVAPCVRSITELPFFVGNVVETIVVPAGDPRFH